MSKTNRISVASYGVCVTIAVVLISGCSVAPYKISTNNLNYFQIDCARKQEQLEFIHTQRVTAGQEANARLTSFIMPWQTVTNPEAAQQHRRVGSGYHNWQLDQMVIKLSNCP